MDRALRRLWQDKYVDSLTEEYSDIDSTLQLTTP
jgi:hypothetical protein